MNDREELRIAIAAQRIEIKRIELLASEPDPFAGERGELLRRLVVHVVDEEPGMHREKLPAHVVKHFIAAGVLIDCGLGCLGVLRENEVGE